MNYADIEANVIAFIKRRVPLDKSVEITTKTGFQEMGLDSLDVAQLLFEAEDAFGVSFDLEKASDITCIGDIAGYILRNRPRATA